MPRGVAIDVVYVVVGPYVKDGLAWSSGSCASGIKKAAQSMPAAFSQWSTGIRRGIIGMPGGIRKEVVHVLISSYVKNSLAGFASCCHAGNIKKTGSRTSGCSQGRARHGRWIISKPGSVAEDMMYVLVRSYIEDRLAGGLPGGYAGRIKKAGN
jgi:hypothetical protein